ncbi:hypothetical protein ACP70R_017880 [Stipagrostis hirtigluma subsp. patula]
MVCLGSIGCQDGHPSAMGYFLTVLVAVTAVVAARLLVCAVSQCLCGDGAAAPHHHSPATTDVDDDDNDVEMWVGPGLAIYGHAPQDVR